MRLSVIIPAYNEEKRLPKTLYLADEYLRQQDYEYEVIVVNGGSTDRTGALVQSLAKQIKNLKLVNTENRGKGHAVRTGMLQAQGDIALFMDADGSTSVDQVQNMWPWFEEGYDVVIGSRDIKGARLQVAQPWWRRTLGDVFNLIVQVVSGLWGVWDTQCGFKGFTKKAAQELFSKSVIDAWAFDVELLVLAKKREYRVKEMPVTWVNDAESKVKLRGMITMLFEVLTIQKNMVQGKYDA